MNHPLPSIPPEWLLLQLADSAYPTGGFAHSSGLEAAFQHKEVRTREHLREFTEAAVLQFGNAVLPFSSAVFDHPSEFARYDEDLDAFTTNHVANRASRGQGRAFLTTSERAFQLQTLRELRDEVISRELPAHFATVFSFVLSSLRFERNSALRLLLYNQLRGILSSAVRLNIIGPLDAQALQAELAGYSEGVLVRCALLSVENATQSSPLVELFQGTQDRLYSRLFQS